MANPGKKLYFSQFGGTQPIPPEFLAAMNLRTERQSGIDNSVGPEALSREIVESKVETDRTNEKVRTTIKVDPGPHVLRDIRTNQEGQPVQVTRTLFHKDDPIELEIPDVTRTVAIADLGNGWSIQEVGIEGKYVKGAFVPTFIQDVELVRERDDPVPDRFKLAVPRTKTEEIVEGDAEVPTLEENDIRRSERQLNFYKKMISILTRDGITLPVVLTSLQTDDKGQSVLVTETYREVGIDAAPLPSATQDVELVNLGEGHQVLKVSIKSVFTANEYTKQIPDVIPMEFRAAKQTTRTASVTTGTAALPSLSTGELEKSERQITKYTKLIETLARASVSLPVIIVNKKMVNEYGGGQVLVTRTLATQGTLSTQQNEGNLSSEVIDLGDGHEVRETVSRIAGSWPILPGYDYDPELQIIIPYTEQVVAKGSTTGGISGDTITTVAPLDFVREKKTIRVNPAVSIDNFYRVIPATTNVDLPTELLSITGKFEKTHQDGSYSEAGAYSLGGHGSGGVDLSGHCEAAAIVMSDISFATKQAWGNGVACTHVLMYMAFGSTRAQILTRLSSILGTVNPWPKFALRDLSIICKGERVSLKLLAAARAHSTTALDYNGFPVSVGESRSNGFGGNYEVAVNLKIIRIPPTIHKGLTITPNTDSQGAAAGCAIDSGAGGGGSVSTGSVSVTANGSITPTSISGTTSDATYYQSYDEFDGLFLHRLVTEVDRKYARLRVLAEVVDSDDVGV